MKPGPGIARMRARRDATQAQLHEVRRQIAAKAEQYVRSSRYLPETFGRHASDWQQNHERAYQIRLSEVAAERRNETGALEAKLKRQNAALQAAYLTMARKRYEPE